VTALSACTSLPGPLAGTWKTGVATPTPRYEGFTALFNGKIYYLGGMQYDGASPSQSQGISEVDAFDPATGRWSVEPSLPTGGPLHHLAVAVIGPWLYVLGGFTGTVGGNPPGNTPNPRTYVFDGTTWTRLSDQPLARGAATAQVLGGYIYVAGGGQGGADNAGNYADLWRYDPVADAWKAMSPMHTAREHLASCAIGGKMIVVGGWNGPLKTVTGATESYDPAMDTWTVLPDMPTPRGGLGAAALNGQCFVMGGEEWPPDARTFGANEAFDPVTQDWTLYAPLPTPRHGLGETELGGSIYATGGGPMPGNSFTTAVEVFTP
jgi:non-specific serine/threonine protein kinase